MAGCCGGPAPAIGVVLIILGVINLGLLPCSIPTIVLGSVLSGCCCVGCHVKSLATYVIVANTLLLVIQLGAGIGLLSSQDSICASILKIDSPIPGVSDAEYYVDYIKGTQALTDGCNFCRMIPAFCDSNAVLGCELCERGALSTYATLLIVGSLLVDLPTVILSAIGCKKHGKTVSVSPSGTV